MPETEEAPATAFRPFATFALIWAVTTLAHQLAFTFWTESWQGWVLVTAAIAVIFRPSCVMRFLILAVSSLLNLWHKLPFVPNHILYEGMLHIIMLLGALSFFWKGSGKLEWRKVSGSWKSGFLLLSIAVVLKAVYFTIPDFPRGYLFGALTTLFLLFSLGRLLKKGEIVQGGDDYFARFAPVIRVAVLIMYVWAVIQKLNWDYFDPEVSCAAKLHKEINAYFGSVLPEADWALVGAAVGSLVFELGIPILLFIPRTRFIGFTAAIWFHLWLSIHPAAGIFSFSSIILALLAVFIPVSWGEELQKVWKTQLNWLGKGDLEKGRTRAHWITVLAFFVTLIIQGALYLLIARSYEVFHTANRVGFFAFFAWGCWIGTCYLIAGWRGRRKSPAFPNRLVPTFVLIGLIPIIFNGVQPWIGGRTQTSFSMYSNLRSEGAGNHMFLKRADLLKLQTDMVEILTSKPNILAPSERPRGIQQFANIGHRVIPWFEFRRLVSEMPGDFEVTYTRSGEEKELGRKDGEIYGDKEAFETIPLLQRKFLWFRRLESIDGPMCCTH